jgi:NAD(P)H-nitrite reductase large subunit
MRVAIVGTGIAGVTLAEEIRKLSPETEVALLTRENEGYYSRPLLSHGFTRADIETRIVLKSFAALIDAGIRVENHAEVLAVDPTGKSLAYRKADEECALSYDALAFAAGSDALIPPPFRAGAGKFHVLNSLADLLVLRRLRAAIQAQTDRPRWAVVGGGLIGCEISADLRKAGDEAELFHALPRLMERQLVEEDSETLLRVLREDIGVKVNLDCAVQGFEGEGTDLAVVTPEGAQAGFHGIVVACGFKPRIELALAAGLATGRGIRVDHFLQTGDPDIYALGDCAELPDGRLYAYVTPVRHQALWLAKHLAQTQDAPWTPPAFKPKAKVPGFEAKHSYLF